jgi:hypothetical protein
MHKHSPLLRCVPALLFVVIALIALAASCARAANFGPCGADGTLVIRDQQFAEPVVVTGVGAGCSVTVANVTAPNVTFADAALVGSNISVVGLNCSAPPLLPADDPRDVANVTCVTFAGNVSGNVSGAASATTNITLRDISLRGVALALRPASAAALSAAATASVRAVHFAGSVAAVARIAVENVTLDAAVSDRGIAHGAVTWMAVAVHFAAALTAVQALSVSDVSLRARWNVSGTTLTGVTLFEGALTNCSDLSWRGLRIDVNGTEPDPALRIADSNCRVFATNAVQAVQRVGTMTWRDITCDLNLIAPSVIVRMVWLGSTCSGRGPLSGSALTVADVVL